MSAVRVLSTKCLTLQVRIAVTVNCDQQCDDRTGSSSSVSTLDRPPAFTTLSGWRSPGRRMWGRSGRRGSGEGHRSIMFWPHNACCKVWEPPHYTWWSPDPLGGPGGGSPTNVRDDQNWGREQLPGVTSLWVIHSLLFISELERSSKLLTLETRKKATRTNLLHSSTKLDLMGH